MEDTPQIPQRLFGDFTGQLSLRYANDGFISALGDLFYSEKMTLLRDGRNKLYRLDLPWHGAPLPLAVKQFGRSHPLKEFGARWKGGKAKRSWLTAEKLQAGGVGTPEPVGYLEVHEGGGVTTSYYLSHFEEHTVSFRDEMVRLFRHQPLCRHFMALLQVVADAVRAMHAAGVQHNDLGNQNILLRRAGEGKWRDAMFIDLNRARLRDALSLAERARDVSRLDIPSDLLRVFNEMLFAPEAPPADFLRREADCRRRFALHTRTRRWRHPVREARIAAAAVDDDTVMPPERDQWIWDDRSEQPVPCLVSRDRHRHYSWVNHLHVAAASARRARLLRGEAARLEKSAFLQPVDFTNRIGIAIGADAASFAEERRWLRELGPVPVIVRFYHHETQREWDFTLEAMRQLKAGGHSVTAALCQDRRAVLQPGRWKYFVHTVARGSAGVADELEIGHAINRVKWGLWTMAEYHALMRGAADVLQDYPNARVIGPAVIDFEWHQLAAALDALPPGIRLAGLSHHLYVDRRGAPENPQGRHGLVGKLAVIKAFARHFPRCEDRVIVSETNWPLLGTGVWSPVGAPYVSPGERRNDPSVSEEDYARYLARYYLLAIGSGLADRVYWWKLAAHGFGLLDPHASPWKRRPGFDALVQLVRATGRSTMVEHDLREDGLHHLRFEAPARGPALNVVWRNGPDAPFQPSFPVARAEDMLGRTISVPGQVGASPVYLFEAGPRA